MINLPPIRAAIAAAPGDLIGVSKAQLQQLVDEAERGQRARRELINLKSLVAVAGMTEIRG